MSGTRPPASTRARRRDPRGGGRAGGEGERCRVDGGQRGPRGRQLADERRRVGVAGAAEGEHVGQRAGRQRGRLGLLEQRVGAGERRTVCAALLIRMSSGPFCGHGVCERDDLCRVAQVDADDVQSVQPVGAVRHRGEAADGVVREPGGDRRVRAVAQQPQRDVHPDLGAAPGQQRTPAGEVGARVAAGAVGRGAVRAQLVVERVDPGEAGLADVAGPRPDQSACRRTCGGRGERDSLGLVVDATRGAGRGGVDHGGVGGEHLGSPVRAPAPLHALEDVGGRSANRDGVRVLRRQVGDRAEHPQAGRQVGRVDPRTAEVAWLRGRGRAAPGRVDGHGRVLRGSPLGAVRVGTARRMAGRDPDSRWTGRAYVACAHGGTGALPVPGRAEPVMSTGRGRRLSPAVPRGVPCGACGVASRRARTTPAPRTPPSRRCRATAAR